VNKLKRLWKKLQREVTDPTVVFSPPVTPDPEATRALEEQWKKRQQELAGWAPTNGWLVDQL
jgi:hypothetical protein